MPRGVKVKGPKIRTNIHPIFCIYGGIFGVAAKQMFSCIEVPRLDFEKKQPGKIALKDVA